MDVIHPTRTQVMFMASINTLYDDRDFLQTRRLLILQHHQFVIPIPFMKCFR